MKPKYYCNPLDPDSTLNKDWNSPVEGLSEKKPSTGKPKMNNKEYLEYLYKLAYDNYYYQYQIGINYYKNND